MAEQYLFDSKGNWIAFRIDDYIFDINCNWAGWMPWPEYPDVVSIHGGTDRFDSIIPEIYC